MGRACATLLLHRCKDMFTKIDLCSMALLKLGEEPIQSWNEDTASAQLARSLFNPIIDTLLTAFPWRFATQKIVLTRNTDGDIVIPTNVLRIIKCDNQITENKIDTPENTTEITAIIQIAPELFPSYFAKMVATRLAMEFCIPLTGDANMFKMMTALYESEFQTAKFIDSTTSNQSSIDNFSLISSRF